MLISTVIDQFGQQFGANGLPYPVPLHPNLVHLTLGLFIVGVSFDIVASFFVLDKPLFNLFDIPTTRANLFDVGWYNVLGASIITFFTVAAGFYEMLLANPPKDVISPWGLNALDTMLWHALGGLFLLALMVGMTVWRGFQRFLWRQDQDRQVQWSYLLAGLVIFFLMFLHGTLGAHLGSDFALHVSADYLLRMGENPNELLKGLNP